MKRSTAARLLGLAALALCAWLSYRYWIEPLLRPPDQRGPYFFGRYHLVEIYRGVPVLVATAALLAALLAPRRLAKAVAFRAFAVALGLLVPLYAFDLWWSLVHLGAWKPIYWLDLQHISRQENLPDPELGFRRKPNIVWRGAGGDVEAPIHYRTDALGFRNPPDRPDRADIVFVGDSYTEAAQVDEEETFVRRVGRLLDRPVVNLGMGAYGPPQERIVLERYGLSFEPKVVVWQLFEGNDLGDAEAWDRWRRDPDRVIRSLEERYVQNSFFRPLLDLTARSHRRVPIRIVAPDGAELRARLRYPYVPDYAERKAVGLRLTLDAIAWGAEQCRARDARLVLVFVPIMLRVLAPWVRFEDAEARAKCYPTDEDPAPSWAEHVARRSEELGVTFVDLFEPLRRRAEQDPFGLYIPTDEHFDLGGHEVAASAIAEAIGR